MKIHITFDSNAWEKIVTSSKEENKNFQIIRRFILNKTIMPYICEIALSIESIMKNDRLNFWTAYKPTLESEHISSKIENEKLTIHSRVCFSPNTEDHPGLHPTLKNKLVQANNLGFKVLRMTNLGTVRTAEIPNEMYCDFTTTDDFWTYAEKLAKLSDHLIKMKCGGFNFFELKNKLGLQKNSIQQIIREVNMLEKKKFSKAIAEWVDGEALSAHYASGNAIFCSNDNARSSGKSSVFSKANVEKLKATHDITIISTDELAEKLMRSSKQ